jgi:hypothetical protein
VRRQLILQKGYADKELPTAETIGAKLNAPGYSPKKVAKTQPKKSPRSRGRLRAGEDGRCGGRCRPEVLRVSLEAKATVKVGPFSRGGRSRVAVKAAGHAFQPVALVTPVGRFLPQYDESALYGVTANVTADCLVDRRAAWWARARARFSTIAILVRTVDNGPENHRRRTQCMARLAAFVDRTGLTVRLAYSPPYQSKPNPIERCLGHPGAALEWRLARFGRHRARLRGDDDVERSAAGSHPRDDGLSARCPTDQDGDGGGGSRLRRLPGLEKSCVDIVPLPLATGTPLCS